MEKGLKRFLLEFNKVGYASGEEERWAKEEDGSKTISFEKGKWKARDNFFGGEPYGGRTVVFYDKKPDRMMVYYGWVEKGINVEPIYKFLQEALKEMPEEYPFRGPEKYSKDNYVYLNLWRGNIKRFSGEEKITKREQLVYKANYMGGLVDI